MDPAQLNGTSLDSRTIRVLTQIIEEIEQRLQKLEPKESKAKAEAEKPTESRKK